MFIYLNKNKNIKSVSKKSIENLLEPITICINGNYIKSIVINELKIYLNKFIIKSIDDNMIKNKYLNKIKKILKMNTFLIFYNQKNY